jgi:hypothetical protein
MKDVMDRINYDVFKTEKEPVIEGFVAMAQALYKFCAIGKYDKVRSEYIRFVGGVNSVNFQDASYDETAADVVELVHYLDMNPVKVHANSDALPFYAKLEKVSPKLVPLLEYMSLKGESLLPDHELIEKITAGDVAFFGELMSDWQILHKESPYWTYHFLYSLAFVDDGAVQEWKKIRRECGDVQSAFRRFCDEGWALIRI